MGQKFSRAPQPSDYVNVRLAKAAQMRAVERRAVEVHIDLVLLLKAGETHREVLAKRMGWKSWASMSAYLRRHDLAHVVKGRLT